MDEPVTDVGFVCDPQNCPDGYSVVTRCPCGHDAQLWEKLLGGEDRTRYLCFTKKPVDTMDESKDLVIESIYIPGSYLLPGYSVIARTIEGERLPLNIIKQLALKKVPRSQAKKVVADVVIAKGKDDISKSFKRLEKINGVRICYRQVDYKPSKVSQKTATVDDLAATTGDLSLDGQRNPSLSASKVPVVGKSPYPSTPSPTSPLNSPPVEGNSPYPSNPNSSTTPPPVVEEMAFVQTATPLASAPPTTVPPTTSPSPPQDQNDSPTTDQQTTGSYPPESTGSYPPQATGGYPPQTTGGYPPAASRGYPPQHIGGYPPTATGGYPPQPTGGYPPTTSSSQSQPYPPLAQSGGYSTFTGQPGGFPLPPTTTVGYDTNIGFSFGGPTTSYPPTQPGQYGEPPSQYPPPYPSATASNQSTSYPSKEQAGPHYGFL